MHALIIILGFIILVTGQQLPWLFVAAMGLIAADQIGQVPHLGMSEIGGISFSLGVGLVSGLLVIYFRRVMLVLAGFIAGVYICYFMPASLGWNTAWVSWPVLVLAGLLCAGAVFTWNALPTILISALAGTTLVIQYVTFPRINELFLFVVFLLFGVIAQWILMQYSQPEPE